MNPLGSLVMLIGLGFGAIFGTAGVGGALANTMRNSATPGLPSVSRVEYEAAAIQPVATKKTGALDYLAQASAAAIHNVTTGQMIYQKDISKQLPIASLTKLMTVLVILQTHHDLSEVVTVPDDLPTLGAADQKLSLQPGEKFYLGDLLKATLIYSANDAANTLAIWDAGSIDKFADKMNKQAKAWGLENSQYKNPTGLDELGHYSSVKDLLTLSTILIQSPKVRETVNTQAAKITSLDGKPYILTTTNHDLGLPYVFGIKTGKTDLAGECLILLGRNKQGNEIITVVLNSPNRFLESQNMVNYAFGNYIWQ